jgi:hypothetical protein
MLMRPHAGAIDEVHPPIQAPRSITLALQHRQHLRPYATLDPAIETTGDGSPIAKSLRQVAPGSIGAGKPKDSFNDGTM